jgi:hypothetical protein
MCVWAKAAADLSPDFALSLNFSKSPRRRAPARETVEL